MRGEQLKRSLRQKQKVAKFSKFESITETSKSYIRLADNMLTSQAWSKLGSKEIQIYIEFKRKYNGKNENDLSFTYNESRKLRMNYKTFQKAIDKLITNGFIEVVKEGFITRTCNIYRFSEGWKFYPNNNPVPLSRTIETATIEKVNEILRTENEK